MAVRQTVKDTEFQLYSLAIQPVFGDTVLNILHTSRNPQTYKKTYTTNLKQMNRFIRI